MADRFCRNCGRELRPEDRFCTGCGRPVHATAHVPTPEADVPVASPPHPTGGSQEPPRSVERSEAPQDAPPSPAQPHYQRPLERSPQFRKPILWFLGSLVVAGLWVAYMDAAPGAFVGLALVHMFRRIVVFGPLWLFLGGVFYLFARLRGEKPAFLRVIFNRWLTIFIVILVILSGAFAYLD